MASETPGRSLRAKDTALSETPARRAMSFIVGRRAGVRRMALPLLPAVREAGLKRLPALREAVPKRLSRGQLAAD
ncbi:hypothetical protein GCM10009544_12550 [Streptomyces stramineus]|uniref:Uncharacterized protein n=1 Tax=Streptomyces stramineus TaxID=173861 RepID=A0ABN0ZKT1_9ACTN